MSQAFVRQVPLFATLPDNEIQHLADALRLREYPPQTVIFREGDYGDRFYIVLAGEIEIIKALGTGDERFLGVRGPGDYVGEMSLFERDGQRTASVRARTGAHLLEMTRADFDALLARQPALAHEMLRVLSLRLNEAHRNTIRDLREKNQQLTEAYEALQTAQAQLIEKKQLEHELLVARQVQASLLPRTTPRLPGWDFAARWMPAHEVSGDFYDFMPLHRNRRASASGPAPYWGLVIADVSGKGMPAALFMALARSTVRASVTGAPSLADCITHANRLICADAGQGMFVTLFFMRLEPQTGEVVYVNAGHNPPWLYRAAQDEWSDLTRTGMALGIIRVHRLTQRTLRLQAGDFIFMYTDGIADTTNGAGERLGTDRLRRVVSDHRRASAAEIAQAVERAVLDFGEAAELFDDVTFVIAKHTQT